MKLTPIAISAILLAACTSAPQAPMPTVANVDLSRYLGNWYQVSLIPNTFQAQCVADTQANYALQDTWTGDSIRVTNRCRTAAGAIDTAVGVAKIVPDSQNAKLKVAFFRPFYGNYWVLALGEQYDWVLVGEPKRQFGWVLSRKPMLDQATLDIALNRAQALGYSKTQFVNSPQTNPLN
jgi:apolipoprotein D and lipocalin family protein